MSSHQSLFSNNVKCLENTLHLFKKTIESTWNFCRKANLVKNLYADERTTKSNFSRPQMEKVQRLLQCNLNHWTLHTCVNVQFLIFWFFLPYSVSQAVFSGMTVSTCIWGYVSDNFGRKKVTSVSKLVWIIGLLRYTLCRTLDGSAGDLQRTSN